MKNAMKKLMAFALVAVMLVGVLPFGASADTRWQVNIYIDDATDPIQTTAGDGEKMAIVDLAANVGVSEDRIKGLLVNGAGVGKGYVIEFTEATNIKIVTFTDAEMPAPPVDVTFSVNYGNGTSKKFTMKEGEVAGSDVFPTTITYKGHEFINYTLNDAEVSASSAVHSSWSSEIIQANWAPNGCPKCGWPTANGHADDCSLNPNKPTETPETQAPETQAPVDTAKAYLNVFVNGVKKVETYGAVNETVPVANCISAAKVASANVTSVVLNNNTLSTSGSFQLGAGGSTTNLYLNVSTASTGTGSSGSNSGSNNNGSGNNSGSNNDGSSKPTGEYAYAYIYVGNSNSAAKIYKNEQAFSIGAVVDKFDTADVEKHYAFDYYTLEGSNAKETDDTDVVQVGQTAHIYVKVTQSKLNHNKVYLQIFMNNDFDVPAKTINVTTMASENGLYREGNVKDLILEYFSAKNSEGIKIDGLYPSTGSWVAKFLEDIKVKNVSADQIIEMKEDDYVVFNIMVTNAKLKSASTADSSNPKTADNIYAVVTIMTASAAALAVAFYLNKKRAF